MRYSKQNNCRKQEAFAMMEAENRAFMISDLGTILRSQSDGRQLWVTSGQLLALWNNARLGAAPAAAGLLTLTGPEEKLKRSMDGIAEAIAQESWPGAFCRRSENELLVLCSCQDELQRMLAALRTLGCHIWEREGLRLGVSTVELLSEGGPEPDAEGGPAQRLWPKLRDWISFISAVRGSYETVLTADLAENSFRLTQAAPERADEFSACPDYDGLLQEMAQDLLPEAREEYLRVFGRRNLLSQLRAGGKAVSLTHLQRCRGGALLPAVTRAVLPDSREPGESTVLIFVRTADRGETSLNP